MIKKLGACVREYKLFALLSPVFMVAEAGMEILIPLRMSKLIDYGVELGNMDYIKQEGIRLLLLALVAMVCGAAGGVMASKASSGFAKNLRHDMYHAIQDFSFSNIDKFSSAGLVTRMTTDVTQIEQAFMMLIRMAFRAPFVMVFAFVAAFQINGKLPLVFIVAIPIILVGLVIVIKFGMPLFQKMFGIYDKLNAVVQENVRGIRVVKAYVREEKENEKFGKTADELYATSVKAEKTMAFATPLMQLAMYTVMLLVCWFGAKLVVSDTMTTGQLMSMFSYVTRILTSFLMLGMLIMQFTMSGAAGKRIVEVLDEVPDIKNCDNPIADVKDGSVKFEHVTFSYAHSRAPVNDVSFEIKSGATVGIIGGTGCGKSSIVRLIPRLYDVADGCVYVGGEDVRKYDIKALRKQVSMVLQKNLLFEGTLRENLLWGKSDATDEEIWHALDLAQAKDFVSRMEGGLDAYIEQGGSNVSGGQKQRLCIARALLSSPKIIILDDSTSAVDTATEAKIRSGLKEYIPETTKIIISQRVVSVKDADEIIVLDDGKVSGIGTHDELLKTNNIYREVYESQTKGGDFDEPTAD